MRVHLINPSDVSFGTGVITPRWLYVLAAATPAEIRRPDHRRRDARTPRSRDDPAGRRRRHRHPHRQRAARATRSGRRRASAARGSCSAAFTPRSIPTRRANSAARMRSSRATATSSGPHVLADCAAGAPGTVYDGGRVDGDEFLPARWDLLPRESYMWASVQTVRGCPKHCSFCSVWRTDGQKPRQRDVDRGRRGDRRAAAARASGSSRWPTTISIR